MKTQLDKKDLNFIKSWEKQRTNRFKYAFLHSILFSVMITVMLFFINDLTIPEDSLHLVITFVVAMLINILIQYFLNYSIMEERYQKLLRKKAADDLN